MSWATSIIAQLQTQEEVEFCPRGNSMHPIIKSGQRVKVSSDISNINPGDVVLCTVKGADYLHFVKAVQGDRYLIGNNRGGINGWTRRIYGKLVEKF